MAEEAHGFTVFCDDIRMEIGNKVSFIGCYSGGMAFMSFPAVLPKFGFGIMCRKPMENKKHGFKSVETRIFLPGDEKDIPSIVSPVSNFADLEFNDLTTHLEADKNRYANFNFHMVFAPLTIKCAGEIKVRVVVDGEIIKCGRLAIQQAPQQEPSHTLNTKRMLFVRRPVATVRKPWRVLS